MKKIIKILLWIVGVVLALLLIVTLVAGPVAKGYVNNHGDDLVGRKVHVDKVRLNLFTGHVAVHGFNLYEENEKDVFACFDTLDVSASLLRMLGHTVKLKHITLAGLNVRVQQDGERFNFSSLLEHFASDEPDEPDTTPSPWMMRFYNIRISHAQLHYYNPAQGKQWHVPDVNLRVPGFVLGGDEASEGGLNLGFADGGHLNIDANYNASTSDFDLVATLKDFALKNIEPLTTEMVRLDHMGGTVEAQLLARGNVSEVMKSRVGGTVALHDIDLVNDGQSVAALNALEVAIKNIDLERNRFDITSIRLDGLTARYDQWKDHSTIDDLLVKAEKTDPSNPSDTTAEDTVSKPAAKPLALTVGTLAVTNCNLTYANHTLPDEFVFPVTNLNIEATDLTTAGENNARLRAGLPGGGHLIVAWKGNIDNWKQLQQLFLSVKGLDMKQLSPWTVAYTGQPIEDGIFGLTTRLAINNSQLDNQNKIDIYKAQVGDRRKDVDPEMKLPLKTALYILKDKDDKILIDLPVKGDIDNPEFSYMKVVWKTLGNLLVKVATSPARALGNALGMSSDDLEFIAVDPHQHGLTSEQYHTLSALATIAKSDTLMVISLVQHMPTPANDTVARSYEMRNEAVRRYLTEQGVPAGQFHVSTADTLASDQRTGYSVTSEMKID